MLAPSNSNQSFKFLSLGGALTYLEHINIKNNGNWTSFLCLSKVIPMILSSNLVS